MTYDLYIGDRTFSSWSLRGWLMLEKFGLDYNTHFVGLYAKTLDRDLAHLAPARTVPVLVTPDGAILPDSMAMAETLVELHPDIAFYPRDPVARGLCRTMVAEMHSGFMTLRAECSNMISQVWEGFTPSQGVLSDLARIEELWALARSRHGAKGPWLFGEYTLADAFFAPVTHRMTTYELPRSALAQAYIDTQLADPAFLVWRADAMKETHEPFPYDLGLPRKPWPVNNS
ncbi:glutathione S-transferase [Cognatiyoonia koreensis]|uniref:Glutathione S-transferase n=1 Tax=Cognatiyoonia koreensis TaxID=364200 RepID=A0A1I0QKQ7_9RHOB|nr:glutathione S-transferase [Cognatiyoonia koreensis]SEW27753.1 glutathione S-transferase [Cognatiyoonia koreensis]